MSDAALVAGRPPAWTSAVEAGLGAARSQAGPLIALQAVVALARSPAP